MDLQSAGAAGSDATAPAPAVFRGPPQHALFEYRAKRPAQSSSAAGDSVATLLSSATRADDDFSLSVRAARCSDSVQHALRRLLVQRLSQGTMFHGSGTVAQLDVAAASPAAAAASAYSIPSSIEPPADAEAVTMTYYCLLRPLAASSSAPAHTSQHSQQQSGLDEAADDAMTDASEGQLPSGPEYICCFMRSCALGDTDLDLFRNELDSFCRDAVVPALGKIAASGDEGPAATAANDLDAVLEPWFDIAVGYLPAVIQVVQPCLAPLLDVSLLGHEIRCSKPLCERAASRGLTPRLQADWAQLTEVLSLSKLLSLGSASSVVPRAASLGLKSLGSDSPAGARPGEDKVYTLDCNDQGTTVLQPSVTAGPFAQHWAESMLAVARNPFALKRCIHGFIFKLNQEINTLKRILTHSESSFYALYQAYTYVLNSKTMPDVLLASLRTTLTEADTAPALAVSVKELLTFLDEKKKKAGGGQTEAPVADLISL